MADTALIGQTIAGRFRLTGFIGEGAMASVYRGVQEAEPHDVAVKVMHAHLARDATFAGRFRREAKAASLLKHQNTVQIVDYGDDKGRLYIAMELISGQDLFEMLVLERRFPEDRASRIVAQVCDALTTAHARGIIHRDLKPENVMVIADPNNPAIEHVKVLDFGIAKVLEKDKAPSSDSEPSSLVASALTTVGVVVGTPAYMSPEQCRAEPVDARSDVYSCGILLYQLICGRTPFSGDSPIEIAINQVRMPPDPPSSVVPTIHPRLEQIILKALEKWPAQRQQSAAELRDELLAVLPELAHDRKGVADGKQPPPPEVRPDDRAPTAPRPAAGAPAYAASSTQPQAAPRPPIADDSDMLQTLRKNDGPATPRTGDPVVPTLAPRLPAGVGGPLGMPVGPPISQPGPSSDPFSAPPSIEMFPRPLGPPLVDRREPAQALPAARPPAPITRVPAPATRGIPSWLVLLLAIVAGVAFGVIAHFVAQLRR